MIKCNGIEKKEIVGIPCVNGKDGPISQSWLTTKETEEYVNNLLSVESI